MKNFIVAGLIIAAFAVAGLSQTENAETKEGREVFVVITKWADAVRSRDTKALDSLFAEDLIITSFDGTTRGKKEELEILKPEEKVKTVSIKNDDVKVRVFGTAAVVTALTKMHFVINEKDVYMALRYTAVFAKHDGRWQLVALQTARAPQPS